MSTSGDVDRKLKKSADELVETIDEIKELFHKWRKEDFWTDVIALVIKEAMLTVGCFLVWFSTPKPTGLTRTVVPTIIALGILLWAVSGGPASVRGFPSRKEGEG